MSLRTALVRRGSAQLPVGVRDVARLAGPFAAAYFVHHIILFVDRALATTLGYGSVATIHYAYRLALVVGQLSGVAVSTALFPRIAEQVADNDLPGVRSSLAGALYFVCALGLPAASGLILLRVPLVQVLFERGAFEQGATTAVSQVLLWYALAVLADALCQPLWRVLYAWRSTWAVLGINSLQTGIRILCNLALIHDFGYNGLAISAFLALSIQATVLGLAVRRRLGTYLPEGWWRRVVWVVFATAVALVVASLLAKQLSTVPALALLVISGTSGCVTYLGILLFLRKRAL